MHMEASGPFMGSGNSSVSCEFSESEIEKRKTYEGKENNGLKKKMVRTVQLVNFSLSSP